jgi:hypothetical protein
LNILAGLAKEHLEREELLLLKITRLWIFVREGLAPQIQKLVQNLPMTQRTTL